LPVVQQLIAAHHGTLTYTSEPGRGTTFRITLPLAAEDDAGEQS
jgi:signal transduction histidine kinase